MAAARRRGQRLPGDPLPEERTARALRVRHAGALAAWHLGEGQRALLGEGADPAQAGLRAALEAAAAEIGRRRVRPSVLLPLWQHGGRAIGVASALIGPRAAHRCRTALAEAIEAQALGRGLAEPAAARGARAGAPGDLLQALLQAGCHLALRASERL